jgi:DNA repair photolyase
LVTTLHRLSLPSLGIIIMRHGSQLDPPNRFERVHRDSDLEHMEWDEEYLRQHTSRQIEYLEDTSQTIVTENRSPDIPFRYSINPYRGCVHSCSYCYARPGHEYLGLNAGLDFETKIVVKHRAALLFRKFLSRPRWDVEPIAFSGVTDCYQPAEREFQLTRQCLEVAWECRQPISIVTKNALVTRDLELLQKMAAHRLVHVYLSITTLQPKLAREMEPRTSIPSARLRAVDLLSSAGIPTGVLTAPVIPGLNDSEIPKLLEAARDAGASTADYILLRLPQTVEPVFLEWLHRTQPLAAEKVTSRIRETRGGALSHSEFGQRMVGEGEIADQIGQLFRMFRHRFNLDQELPVRDRTQFRRPRTDPDQRTLFEDL